MFDITSLVHQMLPAIQYKISGQLSTSNLLEAGMSRSALTLSQVTDYNILEALLSLWRLHYPQQAFSIAAFSEAAKRIAAALPALFSQWATEVGAQSNTTVFLNIIEPRVVVVHRHRPNASVRVVGLSDEYAEFPDRGLIDQLWPSFSEALLAESSHLAEPAVA